MNRVSCQTSSSRHWQDYFPMLCTTFTAFSSLWFCPRAMFSFTGSSASAFAAGALVAGGSSSIGTDSRQLWGGNLLRSKKNRRPPAHRPQTRGRRNPWRNQWHGGKTTSSKTLSMWCRAWGNNRTTACVLLYLRVCSGAGC